MLPFPDVLLSFLLSEKRLAPPEAEFSFPSPVLAYIRNLVPSDVKGEIREVCAFMNFYILENSIC